MLPRRSVSISLAFVALIATAMSAAPQRPIEVRENAIGRPTEEPRTLSVAGTASDSVAPDVASLTVGAETRGNTARQALDANNEAMTALLEAIKRKGVAPGDIQTGELKLSPILDYPLNEGAKHPATAPPKIIGYEINNEVTILIRDVAKVGEILDAAVNAGVNQIRDFSFSVHDPRAIYRDLRGKALADAREKAEEVAKAAGMTLGLPLTIAVDDGSHETYSFTARSVRSIGKSKAVPISAGEEMLSVTVQVVYELKPAK